MSESIRELSETPEQRESFREYQRILESIRQLFKSSESIREYDTVPESSRESLESL